MIYYQKDISDFINNTQNHTSLKPFFLATFLNLIIFAVFAQAPKPSFTIKGSVIDSVGNKPLSYVTVALQDAKTNAAVKSVISKEDGSFQISASSDKSYVLVVAFTGYSNKTIPVKSENADIG